MSATRLVVLVLVVGAFMEAARSTALGDSRVEGAALVLAVGFALIAAGFVGKVFSTIGLPRLTGYLATGIVVGPHVLAYVAPEIVQGLSLVNGVAIALIALTAGSEIHLPSMRPLAKNVAWITLFAIVGTALLLSVTLFALRAFLPFYEGFDLVQAVAISFVLGVTLASQSPAVVVAIRSETGADGPVARTVLAVVVIADLVIVLLFAVGSSVARAAISGNVDPGEAAGHVAVEIFGSLGVGVGIGAILAAYMRFVKQGLDLFTLVVSLVAAEVGRRIHLNPLLIMLAAGMFVENVLHEGEKLRHAFADASLPVYTVFFTVAGASIDIGGLAAVAVQAGIIAAVRAAGFLGGNLAAARLAKAPPEVARYAGVGLLPQAGLAIALALLMARTFPEFGVGASALVFGVISINEMVAPALFRLALLRAGEVVRDRPSVPVEH